MLARIWIIARKEHRSYFDSPVAYVLLVIFLAASAFFFFRAAFAMGEASLRPFFDLLPWLLLFFVPAVTMRSFSAERKDGTLEILLTQPVTEFELMLGKLLGNLLFMVVALVLTLLMPIALSFGGSLDFGVLLAQYAGALLLIFALSGIGLFASALTKNQTIAFVIALTVTFFFLVAGSDFVVIMVPAPLNSVFEQLGILTHFQGVTRGVIDLRDVVYFLSLGAGFLAITYFLLLSLRLSRGSSQYRNLSLGTVIIVAIVIFANLVSGSLGGRLDLTSQKLYTLSPATTKMVRELPDVLTIKLFASSQLPAEAELVRRDVRDIVADLKNAGRGNIKLQIRNPDTDEEARNEAQAVGVLPVRFNVVRQDELQLKQGYLGIAVQFGDKTEAIPFVGRVDDLEYQLAALVRKITAEEMRKIVFLTGHGEKSLAGDMQEVHKQLSQQYAVDSLDPDKLGEGVAADVAAVVAAGPTGDLPEAQEQALKQYIESGGSLLLLIDQVTVNPQFMMAERNQSGFSDLAKDFGVTVNSDLVYDLQANQPISLSEGQLNYVVAYPLWIQALPASEALPVRDIRSVVLPWVSSVSVGELSEKAKSSILLGTSEFGGRQQENYNISPTDNPAIPSDDLKTRTVAVSLSGLGESQKGRMLVVGDSDFVTDTFIRSNPENLVFTLNAADWLSQDSALISIRSKNAAPRPLIFSSQALRTAARYLNMVFVPLAVVLAGIIRLARRRRRARAVYPA